MTAQASFWWEDREDAADIEEMAAELVREREDRRRLSADLDAAAGAIQTANAAYELALRRVRGAPHGETNKRRADLRDANARVLAAEVRYADLQRSWRWD